MAIILSTKNANPANTYQKGSVLLLSVVVCNCQPCLVIVGNGYKLSIEHVFMFWWCLTDSCICSIWLCMFRCSRRAFLANHVSSCDSMTEHQCHHENDHRRKRRKFQRSCVAKKRPASSLTEASPWRAKTSAPSKSLNDSWATQLLSMTLSFLSRNQKWSECFLASTLEYMH